MDADLKKKFGKKLREIRKEKGLTQEQIAERANMSIQSVSGFETGATFPNYPNFINILKILNIPALRLFLYNEDINMYNNDELTLLLAELLEDLSNEDRQNLINFARFLKTQKK